VFYLHACVCRATQESPDIGGEFDLSSSGIRIAVNLNKPMKRRWPLNFGPAYGHWALVIINTFIVLVFAFLKLAKREEQEAEQLWGEAYLRYASQMPRFLPYLRKPAAVCPLNDPPTGPPAEGERSSS
jgi:hypothetical protein